MKKLTFLVAGLLFTTAAFSQSCLDDVWQCLRNNQAPKAKKFLESCLASNPDNANVLLMKGNVYFRLAQSDADKKAADANYVPRYPDAAWEANEAFLQAIKIDKDVQPKANMMGAELGQRACAPYLYEMGISANKAGKTEDAIKYMTTAARNYELGKESANAAAAYLQAAIIYKSAQDAENEKAMLNKSIKCGSTMPGCYIELYYLYRDANDTTGCGDVLKQAKKNLPEALQIEMADAELNYYSFIGDNESLNRVCDEVIAKDKNNIEMIGIVANYLNNNRSFAKAEQILKEALAVNPQDFNLNYQMGYRYYCEMLAFDDEVKALQAEKKWNEVVALQKPETDWSKGKRAAMEAAHDWCEKAYQINNDHLDNNKCLRQLKLLLGKEIPAELNEKINARMH